MPRSAVCASAAEVGGGDQHALHANDANSYRNFTRHRASSNSEQDKATEKEDHEQCFSDEVGKVLQSRDGTIFRVYEICPSFSLFPFSVLCFIINVVRVNFVAQFYGYTTWWFWYFEN